MRPAITRRGFLQLSATTSAAGRQGRRPNILLVISDDQSWAHTGATGDPYVRTPAFDRVAHEGVLFAHAFCASPSCAPSRAALLTGQNVWRLGEGANMRSHLPARFVTYTDLLEADGYRIGYTGKGWGPGRLTSSSDYSMNVTDQRRRNPAGDQYKSFEEFLRGRKDGQPFCFWFGSANPHRPFVRAKNPVDRDSALKVPPFLPDSEEVRADLADYYAEVEAFDSELDALLRSLDAVGLSRNTIVAVTSDNGMGGMPRAKCNLYDYGVRMPLAIRWPERVPGGRVIDDFVSHIDLAPTFLEAASVAPPDPITGRSLLGILRSRRSGRVERDRDRVYTGRERHSPTRTGGVGYPSRAIRTYDFLYIRNYATERWPAGNPPGSADVDASPTRDYMIRNRADAHVERYYELAFAKRPAEELYDLKKDPEQLHNVAEQPAYARDKHRLARELDRYLKTTSDPRATGDGSVFDRYPYWK